MDHFDEEGTTLLAPLRDVEPTARSSVDIAHARKVGRRRQRSRVVAGVVAVVVAVAAPTVLVAGWPHGDVLPAGPGDYFDPLEQVVTVGSAGGFTPRTYRTGRDKQVIELVWAAGDGPTATVTVYPPAAAKGSGDYAWEWTPGAWATISVAGAGGDLKDRLARVAESVRPDLHKPVTLPFSLPATLNKDLVGVSYDYHDPYAVMAFQPSLTVGIAPANDQVEGHPVVVPVDTSPELTAYATDDDSKSATLRSYAAAVRVVPNPNDRSTWVPPFRVRG
ncbi:hypothetical protein [Actinocrispum wychmicini]|uniref:Uncharacterized protein n=1 Tax=Actinocrispum wychmicini TaxID=1213861 RepID=A0A4V2S713_9PSEU|nr:hypothetical protein [Actinocrispum wychmicini]TCO58160.1 hypothetical protein EV192_105225 [Actinocrispum wychmicini]